MGSDYLFSLTPLKPTNPPGEEKEPYKRKKGGASPLSDDAPPLLYPYSFFLLFFLFILLLLPLGKLPLAFLAFKEGQDIRQKAPGNGPYPYMIFANMQKLGVTSVRNVVKVGDTISDVKEGVNAGVWTVGVVEGSSELGLSQEEFEALTPQEREAACRKVEESFREAGAQFVIRNLSQLPELICALGN